MEILEALRVFMWIASIASLIVSIALGIIYAYHWNKYSGDPWSAKLSIFTYSVGALVLVLIMIGSIPL